MIDSWYIQMRPTMEVWGVNSADNIYKRPVDGSGAWTHIGGKLKHVSASGNGWIWGVNSADHIFKCKKPCNGAWIRFDGLLKQIDGGEKYVYGVNTFTVVHTYMLKLMGLSPGGTFQASSHTSQPWGLMRCLG